MHFDAPSPTQLSEVPSSGVSFFEPSFLCTQTAPSAGKPVSVEFDLTRHTIAMRSPEDFSRIMEGASVEVCPLTERTGLAVGDLPLWIVIDAPPQLHLSATPTDASVSVGLIGTAILFSLAIWRQARRLLEEMHPLRQTYKV